MSMKWLEVIDNQVLFPAYKYQLSKQESRGERFDLPESNPDASCRAARFEREKGKSVLVYKFDREVRDEQGNTIREPFSFLQPGESRAKCDYLLFYPIAKGKVERLYVIICNLKSGKTGNNATQLLAGEALAKWIVMTAKRMCENTLNIGDEVKFLKILFSDRKLPLKKGKTDIRKSPTSYKTNNQSGYIAFDCKSQTCNLDILCNKYST